MTVPAATQADEQVELIQLTIPVSAAHDLTTVLPWVLQALQDRPGLTAKQRRRRSATRSALEQLLAQLGEVLVEHPAPDGHDASP